MSSVILRIRKKLAKCKLLIEEYASPVCSLVSGVG